MKKFLPFMTGFYTTAPGLIPLSKGENSSIFDVDETYPKYRSNKDRALQENSSKYFCTSDFRKDTNEAVCRYLASQMMLEYHDVFRVTDGDFSSLVTQLQEDVAVIQLDGDRDWLAAIHLCSPNHWDPRTKIGRPFNEIHTPVPQIERTVKNYPVMLRMVIDKGPYTRFAWGISTDDRLNHHPEPPPGADANEWHGRKVIDNKTEFFVRVERQNLIGLREVNAFIFTIRTYFYRVAELTFAEKERLTLAINSMTKASLEYKGMFEFKDFLVNRLAIPADR